MDWLSLLISLVSGAAGGNIVGALMKEKSLGTLGNSIAGLFGGGIGRAILQALGMLGATGIAGAAGNPEMAANAANVDITQLLGNIGGSGIGGAILTLLITLIKNAGNRA